MSGGKRVRAGRKPVKIDLEQVEKLCNLQCTDEELASYFGVSVRTIERRKGQPAFAELLARGKAKGRLSLRRNLWFQRESGGEYFSCQKPARLSRLFLKRTEWSQRRTDTNRRRT